MEWRQTSRLKIHCPVVFMGDTVIGKGTVTNLSASGCGIESTTLLRKGYYTTLTLALPRKEEPTMIGIAAVRWALGGRAGLEFIGIEAEEQKQLRRLVTQNQREP